MTPYTKEEFESRVTIQAERNSKFEASLDTIVKWISSPSLWVVDVRGRRVRLSSIIEYHKEEEPAGRDLLVALTTNGYRYKIWASLEDFDKLMDKEVERRKEKDTIIEPNQMRQKGVSCSLCDREQNAVSVMIASRGLFICDMCVQICVDIIRERSMANGKGV